MQKLIGMFVLALCVAVGLATIVGLTGYAAQSSASRVATGMATVKGKQEMVLTDARGHTVYYLTTDTATASACTGGCANVWPPLLSSAAPVAASPLPGKLGVVQTANGPQVTYNGHLLYVYSADTAPAQANGDGIGGRWFAATPSLVVLGGSVNNSNVTSNDSYDRSGGYGR